MAGSAETRLVEVLKLTLAPTRRYVVPYTNPGKSAGR
jgi:hypothetical protein